MAGPSDRRIIFKELVEETDINQHNISRTPLPPLAMSPEEFVIENRGCHKKLDTHVFGASDPICFQTPTNPPTRDSVLERPSSTIITAAGSSPRECQNFLPEGLSFYVANISESFPICKGPITTDLKNVKSSGNFKKGFKALSHGQLVELINGAVRESPGISAIFQKLLPVPDLAPAVAKLSMLQHNIYKAFPCDVWGSEDTSYSYKRVRVHLETFQKECLDRCSALVKSEHWPTVLEYIFIAWKLTMSLPEWTNTTHNRNKNFCMKQLAAQFLYVMKQINLDQAALSEIIERMAEFSENRAVKYCIKRAVEIFKTLPMDDTE